MGTKDLTLSRKAFSFLDPSFNVSPPVNEPQTLIRTRLFLAARSRFPSFFLMPLSQMPTKIQLPSLFSC